MLEKFSEAIRGNLSKLDRMKLVALVTIEVSPYYYYTEMWILFYFILFYFEGSCKRYH